MVNMWSLHTRSYRSIGFQRLQWSPGSDQGFCILQLLFLPCCPSLFCLLDYLETPVLVVRESRDLGVTSRPVRVDTRLPSPEDNICCFWYFPAHVDAPA